jgi:predicted O-linked N-acetylglucosamine transferase (SPINDLY family)
MFPSIQSLLQQKVVACISQEDYDTASILCLQLLKAEPVDRTGYWYLGLVQLLQGREAEAQMTWRMALGNLEFNQLDSHTQNLVQILGAGAEHQETLGEILTAWLLRKYIQEFAPKDFNNLLHLVQLSIQLENFIPEALVEWDVMTLLPKSSKVDTGKLLYVVRQIVERVAEHPRAVELVEACLPYLIPPTEVWIERFLDQVRWLAQSPEHDAVACCYLKLCERLHPQQSDVLLQMSFLYRDLQQYEKAIEFAERCYNSCQNQFERVVANAALLKALISSGHEWQQAEAIFERQSELLKDFLVEITTTVTLKVTDASILHLPFFFYPYFQDTPEQTRLLQNRIATFFQQSFHLYLSDSSNVSESSVNQLPRESVALSKPYRKLRIGYLSRSMRQHSVGWLCRWIFQYFNRDRFEIYAYFNQQPWPDPFVEQWFVQQVDKFHQFDGNVTEIVKAIRDDGIDILVDLDSLTSNSNCCVLALKPAPVQVTWLGLDASGIPAIDYFIVDPYVLPDTAQMYYNERLWRLPQTFIAVDGFEVGVPTLRREQLGIPSDAVVYLSSQNAYKRHPDIIRLQMQILKAVPNSHFLIKGQGNELAVQERFYQIAAIVGVDCDRLRFLSRDPDEATHRANLAVADVVLDTFPYNGATTTLETLWMGIPIVTRVGQQFAARNSYTMMINAGITEGIAWTDEAYIDWGIRLGRDADLRQQVTWKLQQSRRTSPLWNAQQFTRDMETAYEQIWFTYSRGYLPE